MLLWGWEAFKHVAGVYFYLYHMDSELLLNEFDVKTTLFQHLKKLKLVFVEGMILENVAVCLWCTEIVWNISKCGFFWEKY